MYAIRSYYEKALSLDPESAEGHYSYGNLLSEMGRFSEAEEEYKKALALNPYYPPLHYSYGLLRITSYNVCYTKLLRKSSPQAGLSLGADTALVAAAA